VSVDKPGFEAFYRHWKPQVRRFLVWYEADHTLVDDATQVTMISAYRYWGKLQTLQKPGAWLFKIARQRLADERERRHADVLLGTIADDHIHAEVHRAPCPTDAVDDRLAVLELVRKLPPHQIAPIILHFWGYSDSDIGRITGLKPASVRSYRCLGMRTLTSLHPNTQEGA
jgi:RNA polymerase sigma-70 factor, ECF subfamily